MFLNMENDFCGYPITYCLEEWLGVWVLFPKWSDMTCVNGNNENDMTANAGINDAIVTWRGYKHLWKTRKTEKSMDETNHEEWIDSHMSRRIKQRKKRCSTNVLGKGISVHVFHRMIRHAVHQRKRWQKQERQRYYAGDQQMNEVYLTLVKPR